MVTKTTQVPYMAMCLKFWLKMTSEKIKEFLPMCCTKDYGWRQAGIPKPFAFINYAVHTLNSTRIPELGKSISKCWTDQIVGTNVDVKEVGLDDVAIVARMVTAAIKMDAGHAPEKWLKFSRNDFWSGIASALPKMMSVAHFHMCQFPIFTSIVLFL